MKKLLRIERDAPPHWVGDGFPVRTIFSTRTLGAEISPFLMLDYAGPAEFKPSNEPRGVDEHPHRGFETVTVVYQGELEHRDSAGNHGRIGPGDVQWMTAASGVVHEEKHSREFTARGGLFEVVQLWVNLPAAEKMGSPRYQELVAANIPTVEVPDGRGSVRLIAGTYHDSRVGDVAGAAKTFTPVTLWDVRLRSGATVELPLPAGETAGALVMHGRVLWNDGDGGYLEPGEFAVFDRDGAGLKAKAEGDVMMLVLGGKPIDEPIAAYGPFVMNTQEEIHRALADYQNGRMGSLGATV
jgi:redox-sensitive bicupin YhaK (pirin superfamily)